MKSINFIYILATLLFFHNKHTYGQLKVFSDGNVRIGSQSNSSFIWDLYVSNPLGDGLMRLASAQNSQSIYWASTPVYSYGFGTDKNGIGKIFSNINDSDHPAVLSFSNANLGPNDKYKITSFGSEGYNRAYYGKKGTFAEAQNFDFNPQNPHGGLILENAYFESAGAYFDHDYICFWSAGDQGRMVRFYDEDGMIERAYISGTGAYFTNSDSTRKRDIKTIHNGLNCVRKMRGVTYKFRQGHRNSPNYPLMVNGHQIPVNPVMNGLKKDQTPTHYGFLAQEIESILPQVVKEDETGDKFVNYDGLIPVLVEAIKELDAQVQTLKNGAGRKMSQVEETMYANAVLFENTPNPFRKKTTIKMHVPQEVGAAWVYIYDLQGKQVLSVPVPERGQTTVIIEGYQLEPGMFMYALVLDDHLIDSKRMIITD